jgi:hypothetical protein
MIEFGGNKISVKGATTFLSLIYQVFDTGVDRASEGAIMTAPWCNSCQVSSQIQPDPPNKHLELSMTSMYPSIYILPLPHRTPRNARYNVNNRVLQCSNAQGKFIQNLIMFLEEFSLLLALRRIVGTWMCR